MSSEVHRFDRTIKEILRELPRRFVESILNSSVAEVLDTSFPRVKERVADFACRLEDGRIVIVEVLSDRAKDLIIRLTDLYLRAFERYGVPPLILILWISESKCPYRQNLVLGTLRLKVEVRELRAMSCEKLLASEDPNDVLLAVLCKKDKGFWDRVKEVVSRLPEEKRKDFLIKLGFLVRLRSKDVQVYERFVKEVGDMPITIDVKRDPYYKRGYKEGLIEGSILEAQEMVIEALEERFGEIDGHIKKRINAINDRNKLKTLHRLSIKCSNLEEFKKALN